MNRSGLPSHLPSHLEETFKRLKGKREKALIMFLTAGDPDKAATEKLIFAMEKAGADIIELGIPFSDPMADGPTIQRSSERALKKGVTIADIFKLVGSVRKKSSIPLVLFGYYNPIFVYGVKRFAREAEKSGVDGVLVVDLPPEESREFRTALNEYKIPLICLATPTSDLERMRLIAKSASGFIYYVSLAGVTGARKTFSHHVRESVERLKRITSLPIGVGFGISTPAQAHDIAGFADAVIVGSALIDVISKYSGSKKLIKEVERFTHSLKEAIR